MVYIVLLVFLYILGILFLNLKRTIKNKEMFIHILIAFLLVLSYTVLFIYNKKLF